VWYNRVALDQLLVKFRFLLGTEPDVLPRRSGKTVQWFRYTPLAANTSASSEGAVGTGLALTTTTVSATVAEYSDFISISSLLQETAIDPIVQNASEQLGYRAGLSVDTIVRTEFDTATSAELTTIGANPSIQDIRKAIALLQGANVSPKMGDDYVVITHPYVLYDIKSDNTAGGFIDVMKYADPNRMITGEEGRVAGARVFSTTNVKTSGTAPSALYWMYTIGKGAVGAVDLAGSGPSKVVGDPSGNKFKINVIQGGPQIADPEGMIGAAVSYRYCFVAKILDTTYRYRMTKCDVSLV
jgi:N4-gp56 family major capsid protein